MLPQHKTTVQSLLYPLSSYIVKMKKFLPMYIPINITKQNSYMLYNKRYMNAWISAVTVCLRKLCCSPVRLVKQANANHDQYVFLFLFIVGWLINFCVAVADKVSIKCCKLHVIRIRLLSLKTADSQSSIPTIPQLSFL